MKIEFSGKVPIDETMVFDELFESGLALPLKEKKALLENAICIWMIIDGVLAGETFAFKVSELPEEIEGVLDMGIDPEATAYCYSTAILSAYQGEGLSKILKAYFLGCLKGKGFKTVIGHARNGISMEMNRRFGAETIKIFNPWYGTNIDHHLYKIEL